MGHKFCIHHIGGRFGTGGFPAVHVFEKDLVRVFYDADRDCVEQIKEKFRGSPAKVVVLPYCLGSRVGKGLFNINYDTTASSVFSYDQEYGGYYFFSYNHDFLVSDAVRTMETRETDINAIDNIVNSGKVAPPDFLSMDVQGAEYDILTGAQQSLYENVAGLVIETGLHPLYKGQKVFGDLCEMLDQRGFYFVKFLGFHEYAPFRTPVGLRADGFQMLGDVLFLKKPGNVTARILPGPAKDLMLRKMAFAGIVFNQFEYAVGCLNAVRENGCAAAGNDGDYLSFLAELDRAIENMPRRFPPLFSEKYSFEMSRSRFVKDASRKDDAASFRERLWLKYFYPRVYSIAKLYDCFYEGLWGSAAQYIVPDSPVENILKKNGFRNQACQVKKKRILQRPFSK